MTFYKKKKGSIAMSVKIINFLIVLSISFFYSTNSIKAQDSSSRKMQRAKRVSKEKKDNPFANLPKESTGSKPFNNQGTQKQKINRRTSMPSPSEPKLKANEKLILGIKKPNDLQATNEEIVQNFQYPNADILDVAKAIAKLTGKNLIYSPTQFKGKISIVSETPVSVYGAWKAFLTALDMKGFTVIPSGDYFRIEKTQKAKEKQIPIYTGDEAPNTDQFITRIIPLKYVNAKEVEQTFRTWIPREGRMYAYEQTNTLIITDTASHINRFMELIRVLDVQGFQESLAVIPIKYAIAKDLANIIQEIIVQSVSRTTTRTRRTRRSSRLPIRSSTQGKKVGGSSISKIIADERTNSLIVKANTAGFHEVRTLIKKLDTKIAASEGTGRIHVYRLQFADAEELAAALGGISKDSGINNNNNRLRVSRLRTLQRPNPRTNMVASIFEGNIKISPDKVTQSLIITASPQDYSTLKRVIQQLDIPRDQVYVKAIIMEMQIREDESSGISFLSPGTGVFFPSPNLVELIQGNAPGQGLSVGFGSGRAIEIGGQTVKTVSGLLELLKSQGSVNIVATPHLTTMDNQTAEVEIKEVIPIKVTTQTSTGSETGFKNEEATLALKVTPHINKASNFVRLEIEQKLGEFNDAFVPSEVKGEATGKSTRLTKTTISVRDEDTIVMSGLIRERNTKTQNKVPILGDIPVLGWLFKNSSITKRKTDLLIFITPHIIKHYQENRTLLNKRLKERKRFMSKRIDPYADKISEIKKSLPDLSNVKDMLIPLNPSDGRESPNFQNNPRLQQEQKKLNTSPWAIDSQIAEEEDEFGEEELEEEYTSPVEPEQEESPSQENERGIQL